mgnify:CR=1 FL=1
MTTKITNIVRILVILILITFLASCMSGGTHGSLKAYQYSTKKIELEKAVLAVIESNPKIKRSNNISVENDGKYLTVFIKKDAEENEYIFRFAGDSIDWDTSGTSMISISYAFDSQGRGGSEGNGGMPRKVLKQLLQVFESEFINKLDTQLNITHTEIK